MDVNHDTDLDVQCRFLCREIFGVVLIIILRADGETMNLHAFLDVSNLHPLSSYLEGLELAKFGLVLSEEDFVKLFDMPAS